MVLHPHAALAGAGARTVQTPAIVAVASVAGAGAKTVPTPARLQPGLCAPTPWLQLGLQLGLYAPAPWDCAASARAAAQAVHPSRGWS